MDFLPLELLHNIGMWHKSIVHWNQPKLFLVQLTQHHPVLRGSTSYELKYVPFDYCTNDDNIKYEWADRRKNPQNTVHKWGKEKNLNHEPV